MIASLLYGSTNVLSMLIGIPVVGEKEILTIFTATWLFDVIVGVISAAIEILRSR